MFKLKLSINGLKYPCAVCVNGVKSDDVCEGCKWLDSSKDLTLEIEQAIKKAVEDDA